MQSVSLFFIYVYNTATLKKLFIMSSLITLLKTVKLADPTSISEVAEAAEKYIDGSSFEIEKAYQNSYRLAIKAILAGLGEVSILEANTFKRISPSKGDLKPSNLLLREDDFLPVPALYDLLMSCVNFVPDELGFL